MIKSALIFSLFIMSPLWASSVEKTDNELESMGGVLVGKNTFSSNSDINPGNNDPVIRSGLGQDPSRKPGYSSERKDVSTDNTPRSPGVDKSQRTPGSDKYIITKKKQRKMEKSKRIKKEREKMEQEDVKNNPFSDYRK